MCRCAGTVLRGLNSAVMGFCCGYVLMPNSSLQFTGQPTSWVKLKIPFGYWQFDSSKKPFCWPSGTSSMALKFAEESENR